MRGGKRTGAGRPKGAKSRPILRLASQAQSKVVPAKDAQARMADLRDDIALFKGAGLSDEAIAAALDIAVEDLRATFSRVLADGQVLSRAQNLALLRRSAASGSVAAQRAIDAILARGRSSESEAETKTDEITSRALRILQGGKQ